jgi:hypothetical protein
MALDTYSGLLATVQDWCSGAQINNPGDLVTLAEADFNRRLRIRHMIQRWDASIDTQYYPLPYDYLEALDNRISYLGFTYHMQSFSATGADLISAAFSNPWAKNAQIPFGITIIGGKLQVSPAPTGTFSLECIYYQKIPPLSNSNQTNWLLSEIPQLYLYGCLKHAQMYLINDARYPGFVQTYEQMLTDVMTADKDAQYTSPLRITRIDSQYSGQSPGYSPYGWWGGWL